MLATPAGAFLLPAKMGLSKSLVLRESASGPPCAPPSCPAQNRSRHTSCQGALSSKFASVNTLKGPMPRGSVTPCNLTPLSRSFVKCRGVPQARRVGYDGTLKVKVASFALRRAAITGRALLDRGMT